VVYIQVREQDYDVVKIFGLGGCWSASFPFGEKQVPSGVWEAPNASLHYDSHIPESYRRNERTYVEDSYYLQGVDKLPFF